MTEQLKVALIGVKSDGVPAVHISSIAKLQEQGLVKLVAVAETKVDGNKAIDGLVSGKVITRDKVYTDFKSMFQNETIDIVTIAAPHQFHWPMSNYALSIGKSSKGKGINVFSEKPPAVLVQDAEGFLLTEGTSPRHVAVNCMYTASQSAKELQKLLKDGAIGEIKSVIGVGKWCRTNEYYTGRPWAGKRKVGDDYVLDGAMFNQFPHLFRQCLFFTGKDEYKADNVLAELYRAHSPDILEMEGTGCLNTSVSGVDVFMYFTTSYHQDDALTVEIRGTKGTAYWTCDVFGESKQTLYKIVFNDERPDKEKVCRGEDWQTMCLALYKNFVDVVNGKDVENYSPLAPAALHVSVVNGAYMSSGEGMGLKAIRQIGTDYIQLATEPVGASGTGIETKGNETKVLISGIGNIINAAAKDCFMYSSVPDATWAKASKPVSLANLTQFNPDQVLG